jgi:hypothetical protein
MIPEKRRKTPMSIDVPTLVNWIVSGFIGLAFGIISAWVTYRYGRKRDDIAWQREKEKLQRQFEHEKVVLQGQYQQRLDELERQATQSIRDDILGKKITNYADSIAQLSYMLRRLNDSTKMAVGPGEGPVYVDLSHLEQIVWEAESLARGMTALAGEIRGDK